MNPFQKVVARHENITVTLYRRTLSGGLDNLDGIPSEAPGEELQAFLGSPTPQELHQYEELYRQVDMQKLWFAQDVNIKPQDRVAMNGLDYYVVRARDPILPGYSWALIARNIERVEL